MKNFERYEQLLRSKPFENLSEEERVFALQFGDEEAYCQAHQLLSNLPIIEEAIPQVNPNLLATLLSEMPSKPNLWVGYRRVLAQAAAMILTLCLGWMWGSRTQGNTITQLVSVEKRDTIYLEKKVQVPHYQKVIVYRDRKVSVPYALSVIDTIDITRTLSSNFKLNQENTPIWMDNDEETVVGHSVLDEENSLNR